MSTAALTKTSHDASHPPDAEAREAARMAAVVRFAILDSPPEVAFDRIAALAARLFDAPMATIAIVDRYRMWRKAEFGMAHVPEIPREISFCNLAIRHEAPFIVEDASTDPRTAENPLVVGPLHLRFYAGMPLTTSEGQNIGTLCVLDTEPRAADTGKIEMLRSLGAIVLDEFELRLAARRLAFEAAAREAAEARFEEADRRASTDSLTGLLNRRALENQLDARYEAFHRGEPADGSVAIIDVDGLKRVNDERGHDEGDRFLRAFASALRKAFPAGSLYRYGGDEFVLLFDGAAEALLVREGIASAVAAVRADGYPGSGASYGLATFEDVDGSPRGALRLADSRMYASKAARRP